MTHAIQSTQSHPAHSNANSHELDYFDLHVRGIGYLSRIRTIGKGRNAFLCCSINALRGDVEDVDYTKFDLIIRGQAAFERIKQLESDVNEGKKVLVTFKASDVYPEIYTLQAGKFAGEQRSLIKGRLLQIPTAKINGVAVVFAGSDDNGHNAHKSTVESKPSYEEEPCF
jgi:hypothetical protein